MFELNSSSLSYPVTQRRFGQQHQGISPGGASDQLAFFTSLTLLGDPQEYTSREILFASKITFKSACIFILSGAHYRQVSLNNESIELNRVYRASPGDLLELNTKIQGQWLYLTATTYNANNAGRIGLKRGPLSRWFSTYKKIRLFPGPEFHLLLNPEDFFRDYWLADNTSDRIGIRLKGRKILAERYDIISSTVDDGTIQLTANGPIALLRQRQTTGGYPRIFQTVSCDIDTLVQIPQNSPIRFELISLDEALHLTRQREIEKSHFKQSFTTE